MSEEQIEPAAPLSSDEVQAGVGESYDAWVRRKIERALTLAEAIRIRRFRRLKSGGDSALNINLTAEGVISP